MSVRREKKKGKKAKKEELLPADAEKTEVSGEEIRQAFKETSKVMLFAALAPLKLEISEEKSEFYITSFLLSARFKSEKSGFSFEIARGAMKSADLVCLMKTLYSYYKRIVKNAG